MNQPQISVVIPLYNKAPVVRRTLDTLRAQTFTDFEIVVVDDGSTDGSSEIVDTYEDARIRIITQKNAGPGAARNRGLREARAEYVAFVDADDEVDPAFLAITYERLHNHPQCAVCVCAHCRGPEKTVMWTPATTGLMLDEGPWRMPTDLGPKQVKSVVDAFAAGAILCRKEEILLHGGYYENQATFGEDAWLWLQVLLHHRIYLYPQPVMWYRTETSQLGLGRRGSHPQPPVLTDSDTIEQHTPPEYHNLLRRTLDLYALTAGRENLRNEQFIVCRDLIQRFPKTGFYAASFRKLRRALANPIYRWFYRRQLFKSSGRLHVGMGSYSDQNPYQPQLISALEDLGVRVIALEPKDFKIRQLPRLLHFDILHIHWLAAVFATQTFPRSLLRAGVFVFQLIAMRLGGVKIVWTAHDLLCHDSKYPRLDWIFRSIVVRLAHKVFVHGKSAITILSKQLRLRTFSKAVPIEHPAYIGIYENNILSDQARNQLDIPASHFVFLLTGRMLRYKGYAEAILAFEKINLPDSLLLIAGKPVDAEIDTELRIRAENKPNIRLVSQFIPQDQIQVYMNAADVLLFPYKKILTSGAVLLAMSFAKPCIAPRLGLIPETLDDHGAFLYDPQSPTGLTDAMQKAYEFRPRLPHMGRHNLSRAEKWTWSSLAIRTRDVYLALTGRTN